MATVDGVLSSFDDFPVHQTSHRVARTASNVQAVLTNVVDPA